MNSDTPALPQNIASELMACGSKIQLQTIKSQHGELPVKQAWRLLPQQERDRIKGLCDNDTCSPPVEETQPMTEQPTIYKLEPAGQPKRTLFNISEDLEQLNDLLDEVGNDAQQQELINQWLEQLGSERDRKLDNYSALIVEMTSRAAARKAEAQRLLELAATDENRVLLLRDRLKWFFADAQPQDS
jgi:hypothetical protein